MSAEHPAVGAPAPASVFSVELLAELIRRGVQDVVVCPGSRSQALALAAAAAERAGAIRLHVRVDERSAGFFALGVARETHMPAPVIVTSGTAAAHLGPAVLEAHEGRVPMIVLSADRPEELRGVRSNQTTRQTHLFGSAARLSLDIPAPEYAADGELRGDGDREPGTLAVAALAAAQGFPGDRPAGPVQLNLAFREPLSGLRGFEQMVEHGFVAAAEEGGRARATGMRGAEGPDGAEREDLASASRPQSHPPRVQSFVGRFRAHFGEWDENDVHLHRGDALAVVIAGEGAGPEAEAFAHAAGLPLLAEAVSGSRFGREAVTAYETLIDEPTVGGLAEQAIVFGHPTLSRAVPELLGRGDVDVVVVDPHTGVDHYDPARKARVVRAARVAEDHDPRALRRWLGAWLGADRELQRERTTTHEPDLEAARATGYRERNAYARAEVATMREPVSRGLLVESVWRATWPHDRLVVAASRLVRVLDALAPARRLEVHANRGLAGIDGTVATALGVASASQAHAEPSRAAGTTRVLLGDLALLHDAGSLLLPAGEERPRIQLFVGNDGGGTIFDGLEVAATTPAEAFERVMRTPQNVDVEQLALAYGWDYRRVTTRSELERLLTEPVAGPCIVEVPLPE